MATVSLHGPIKLRVVLGNSVERDHQLTEESTKNTDDRFSFLAPAISISKFLLEDLINWCNFVDKLCLNIRTEMGNFCSPTLSGTRFFTILFCINLVLVCLKLCLTTCLDSISIGFNCTSVCIFGLSHVVSDQNSRIVSMSVNLIDKQSCICMKPWHDFLL